MSEEGSPVKGLTSSRNTSSVFQMITRSSNLSWRKQQPRESSVNNFIYCIGPCWTDVLLGLAGLYINSRWRWSIRGKHVHPHVKVTLQDTQTHADDDTLKPPLCCFFKSANLVTRSPVEVQDCPGSAETGSPRALAPEERLRGGTRSSRPSAAVHSGQHAPPSLPPPLKTAGSSSADLKAVSS